MLYILAFPGGVEFVEISSYFIVLTAVLLILGGQTLEGFPR